ncbi:hypothetical protein RI129_011438 [Pyrocoelia pectoralis]|uniref:Spermatogenesis-associated protein 17 n=1 Tax=Pyrocoelia pectoralis TaxID=417401 RepID=A0AAN7ZFL8_9COLE
MAYSPYSLFLKHFSTILTSNAIESLAKKRNFAASLIQRVFRGFLLRKKIAEWNRAATVLQKYIRRWLVLWHLPEFYEEYLEWRTTLYYNTMATRIQALWKGYKVRKGKLPIKVLLQRRLALEKLNQETVFQMGGAFRNMEKDRMEKMNREAEEKVAFIVFKLHHHLRTYSREGIYSLHNQKKLSSTETLFKSLRFKKYMDDLKRMYYEEIKQKGSTHSYMFEDKKMREIEDLYRNMEKTKPVTRFSLPLDIIDHEEPFDLRSKPKRPPYERKMLYCDKYPPPKFNFARQVDRSKHIAREDFDLFVHKKCLKPIDPPPYHINHWSKKCEEHYFVD